MELAEFPLGGPEAGGFEWSGSAIGRVDGDDDVTALIVPRMPHHVAPRRSPVSPFLPPICPPLSTLVLVPPLAWLLLAQLLTGQEERDFFIPPSLVFPWEYKMSLRLAGRIQV